jgi:hypothetical protein
MFSRSASIWPTICLKHLHLCTDVEHRRQVRIQIIDTLDAVDQGTEPTGKISYNLGYTALAMSFCYVV